MGSVKREAIYLLPLAYAQHCHSHLCVVCKNHVKQQNKAQTEEGVTSDTSPFTAIAVQVGPGPAVNNRGHTK